MTRKHLGGWAVWPAVSLLIALPMMLGQGCPLTPGGGGEALSASAGADLTVELGSSVVLEGSASGGSGVYTYGWSPAEGLSSSTSATPTFTPTATGSYVFTLTVTDSLGAQDTDSVIVTVTEGNDSGAGALVADAGPARSVLVGSSVVLQGTVTGGKSPYTYSWSPTTGLNDPTLPQPTFTPSQAGTTQFTLTVTDDEGTTATDTTSVVASTQTTLDSLTWAANYSAGGYKVVAVFSQNLDRISAETESNYGVSGTDVAPTSAVLATDNRTVALIFQTPLSLNSAIDFSMSNGLKDANGNALPAFSEIPQINSSDTPATAPKIAANGVIWGANYAGSYLVLITFSEAMDRDSAETLSAYRISNTTVTATSAELQDDGKTVEVVFDGKALSTTDTIDVSVGNVIQDINGNAMPRQSNVTISPNPLDITRPYVVEAVALGSTSDGFEASIEFSEAMSKSDVEKKEAYESSGSVLEEPTSATLQSDGRTVILQFTTSLAPTDRIRVGVGNLVKDINGRVLNLVSVEFKTDTGDLTNPNAPQLTWLKGSEAEGYELQAVFREAMVQSSVENKNNWRVQGTAIQPSEVALAEDLKTATVSFAVPLNRDAQIVVSVNGSIRDATGNVLLQTIVPVQANAADTISPQVDEAPTWAPNYGTAAGQVGYQLTLEFSETMDLKSAGSITSYTMVRVDTSVNPPRILQTVGSPSKVVVGNEGRWVTLTFATTAGGFRSSGDIVDRLRISSQVRDMNGRATVSVSPLAIILNTTEHAGPTVGAVKWSTLNNNQPYQVVVRFSEALDAASATDAGNYRINLDGVGPTVGPDEADEPTAPKLSADGRTVTLTFSVDANALFSPTADTLIIDAGVTDINGNPATGLTATGETIEQDAVTDTLPPKLISVTWGEGPTLLKYRVLATFSEGLDENDFGTYTISGSPEMGDATLLPGGNQVEIIFDAQPLAADSTLTVNSVFDMNGNIRAATSGATLANPLDNLAPAFVSATYTANYPGPGYEVHVVFDEVLDLVTATTPEFYRVESEGKLIPPDDFLYPPLLDVAGTDVTLVFLAPLSAFTDYIDISVAASIQDLNRNFAPQIIGSEEFPPLFIAANTDDLTPPSITAVAYEDTVNPQYLELTFSEVMDRLLAEDPGSYAWSDPGLTVAGAELAEDGVTLTIQLGPGQDAGGATLTVTGLTDINGNPVEPCGPLCGPLP